MDDPVNTLPCPGFEGHYTISADGTIIRTAAAKGARVAKAIASTVGKNGYASVSLSTNGSVKRCYVHRLLAAAFIPKPPDANTINHKDGNRLNNSLPNLEWVTVSGNANHAIRTGLRRVFRSGKQKLTAEQTTAIQTKRAGGESVRSLASQFGVTARHIYYLTKTI